MCVQVVVYLPQRLKSTFFEILSSLLPQDSLGPFEKISKNIDFLAFDEANTTTSLNCTFFGF